VIVLQIVLFIIALVSVALMALGVIYQLIMFIEAFCSIPKKINRIIELLEGENGKE
jgi:hypothetical protein